MTTEKQSETTSRRMQEGGNLHRRDMLLAGTALAASTASGGVAVAQAQRPPVPPARSGAAGSGATATPGSRQPNILVIWGDDVGIWNISAYHRGQMGGSTPNIDRIAREGMLFMDHYAQASCTAGGFKVPMMVKWPGVIPAGTTTGELMTMEDWIPTIMAQLGQTEIKKQLFDGRDIGGRSYKVHLDGYDQTAVLKGTGPSARQEFFFFTETTFHGVRYGEWKFLFTKQDKWFNGVQEELNTPQITRLDLDPFERFYEARGFDEWQENRSWAISPALGVVQNFVKSFEAYPARQTSFSPSAAGIVEKMMAPTAAR